MALTANAILPRILVTPNGTLVAGALHARCAVGRAGVTSRKREGDGATPRGRFRLLAAMYRPDRLARPMTGLPLTAIRPGAGWCDDPSDHAYNQPVRLPYPGRHENLWRDDRLYDVVIVLDYNIRPAIAGAGSAIFLHLAAPGYKPTAGCVAVSLETMRRLLPRLGRETFIEIR
jgi:L,D-peptidoglycan transpeptidase YkuD (ErfK/YbiS/YcfS/YnhG family)